MHARGEWQLICQWELGSAIRRDCDGARVSRFSGERCVDRIGARASNYIEQLQVGTSSRSAVAASSAPWDSDGEECLTRAAPFAVRKIETGR